MLDRPWRDGCGYARRNCAWADGRVEAAHAGARNTSSSGSASSRNPGWPPRWTTRHRADLRGRQRPTGSCTSRCGTGRPDLKGLLADQGGQLPLDWALRLFGQIADALELRPPRRAGPTGREAANILIAESQEWRVTSAATTSTSRISASPSARPSCPRRLTSAGHSSAPSTTSRPEQTRASQVGAGNGHLRAGLRPLRVPDRAASLPPGR